MPFRITQYQNVFSEHDLKQIEHGTDTLFRSSYASNTLDVSAVCKRKKIFLGYRYSYGNRDADSKVYDDVEPIEAFPFVQHLVSKLKRCGPTGFSPNQVVINLYEEEGARLGCHVDSKRLFCRPIISLRLFSAATLVFGVQGIGIQETAISTKVSQDRGEITVMDGFAANCFNHGINKDSIKRKSVSIIVRQVRRGVGLM